MPLNQITEPNYLFDMKIYCLWLLQQNILFLLDDHKSNLSFIY